MHNKNTTASGAADDSLLLCASDLQHSAIYDNPHEMVDCVRAVADRITALAASAPVAPTRQMLAPEFDLSTSAGGRGYVAWYFEHCLLPHGRHDFRSYINGALAADFACALARHLSVVTEAAPVAPTFQQRVQP